MSDQFRDRPRPIAMTIVELLIVVVILTVLLVLLTDVADGWFAEWEASSWTPTEADRLVPPAEYLASEAKLEGIWTRGMGGGIHLSITRQRDNFYEIECHTGGCCGRWRLNRTAEKQGAIIVLNRAVVEYHPSIYDRLYLVHLNGYDFLVPGDSVKEFEEYLAFAKDDRGRPYKALMRPEDQESMWRDSQSRSADRTDEILDQPAEDLARDGRVDALAD